MGLYPSCNSEMFGCLYGPREENSLVPLRFLDYGMV